MSGWMVTEVSISHLSHWSTVTAYVSPDANGLAVHRAVENSSLWTVTHVSSGLGLRCGSVDAENVLGFALQLARIGDWTRDKHAIWSDLQTCHATTRLIEQALASGEYEEIDRPMNPEVPEHARFKRASVTATSARPRPLALGGALTWGGR